MIKRLQHGAAFAVLLLTVAAPCPALCATEPEQQTGAWWWKGIHQTEPGAQFAADTLPAALKAVPLSAGRLERYRTRATHGEAEAQFFLATLYAEAELQESASAVVRGFSVSQDYPQALTLYAQAAGQQHSSAQNNLGLLYAQGKGAARDDAQAEAWFRRAALQGHASAQNNLGVLYEQGRAVERSATLAASWYRKAADQGLPEAQFNLGRMYVSGQGITADQSLAYVWLSLAAQQRFEPAGTALRELEGNLSEKALADAQLHLAEWQATHVAPR